MIDRQAGKILIECDSCPEVFEGERGALWKEVWEAAGQEGWRSRRLEGEWLHGCPTCGVPK